eukprot:CAMPEP_0178895464 /NCGR_PEP_ID=MMETSP0786-20121207/603_1 /TAXON_ID=186022 /ORGANISM="Thalassionema frauenfeldii, Strain CCMP 1798" /LENGTH=326 /DNA_ID=CAMNT_0020565701 /DNA_START=45 /DNA_END=1026 /DNA_ORIENTATION=+
MTEYFSFPTACAAFAIKIATATLTIAIFLDAVVNYKCWNRIISSTAVDKFHDHEQRIDNQHRFLVGEQSRPKMHTYFDPAMTDMTDEANMELLEYWKKAWYDAGWEPVDGLEESHARALPEFDALMDLILDPETIGTYNMACYKRWIAMAAVGGFMADYDTFPLNHFLRHGRELPFAGQLLTIWDRHVPCLVSGNESEYFRMAKKIGLSMQKHAHKQKYINENGPAESYQKQVKWSDMKALIELYERSSDMYIQRTEVMDGVRALRNENWSKEDCNDSRGKRAVHFSHLSVTVGKQAYRGSIHRATIARQFLNRFHEICDYTPVAD